MTAPYVLNKNGQNKVSVFFFFDYTNLKDEIFFGFKEQTSYSSCK